MKTENIDLGEFTDLHSRILSEFEKVVLSRNIIFLVLISEYVNGKIIDKDMLGVRKIDNNFEFLYSKNGGKSNQVISPNNPEEFLKLFKDYFACTYLQGIQNTVCYENKHGGNETQKHFNNIREYYNPDIDDKKLRELFDTNFQNISPLIRHSTNVINSLLQEIKATEAGKQALSEAPNSVVQQTSCSFIGLVNKISKLAIEGLNSAIQAIKSLSRY